MPRLPELYDHKEALKEELGGDTHLGNSLGKTSLLSARIMGPHSCSRRRRSNKALLGLRGASWSVFLVLFATLFTCTECQYKVHRQDPFALLSGTLRTYQQAACDSQVLNLLCPTGTKISIQLVHYGRSAPSSQVCPPTSDYPRSFGGGSSGESGGKCIFPEALKFVEEKCHGQEACSMVTAPEVFGGGAPDRDPCPGVRKYVEVAYKCKPTQFRSRVVCQGDSLKLNCTTSKEDRIAIYSAQFASAAGSHIYCPATSIDSFESVQQQQACESSYATEAVMQMCHGQGSCVVLADGASLGTPECKAHHNLYLKTVYTCMHKSVLKPHYQDRPITTTTASTTTTTTTSTSTTTEESTTVNPKSIDDRGVIEPDQYDQTVGHYDDNKRMKPAETMLDDDLFTPSGIDEEIQNVQDDGTSKEMVKSDSEEETTNFVVGFVSDFFASYKHIQEHKEKFILFISLSIAIGLTLFLGMVVWNMYRSSRLERIAKRLRRPTLSSQPLNGSISNGRSDGGSINAYSSSSNGQMTTSSPAHSPTCPPGAIDIELEVGDHEVDTVFRDPGLNPLIVARRSPPLQLNGNLSTGPYLYGTLSRRPQQQQQHVMSNGRPRSDRLGSDASSSIVYNVSNPFGPVNDLPTSSIGMATSGYNPMVTSNVWTPMVSTAGPLATSSVASGSVRGDSPLVTSPIHQLDQYQLNPYPERQQQPVRYSTIGRHGRGPAYQNNHHHHHNHSGTSPVRSVVIVAPGDPIPPNLQPQQQLQLQQQQQMSDSEVMSSSVNPRSHSTEDQPYYG